MINRSISHYTDRRIWWFPLNVAARTDCISIPYVCSYHVKPLQIGTFQSQIHAVLLGMVPAVYLVSCATNVSEVFRMADHDKAEVHDPGGSRKKLFSMRPWISARFLASTGRVNKLGV
jgi:hypothetical protein